MYVKTMLIPPCQALRGSCERPERNPCRLFSCLSFYFLIVSLAEDFQFLTASHFFLLKGLTSKNCAVQSKRQCHQKRVPDRQRLAP
jgi:hypothetical protein